MGEPGKCPVFVPDTFRTGYLSACPGNGNWTPGSFVRLNNKLGVLKRIACGR